MSLPPTPTPVSVIELQTKVPARLGGRRLDQALAELFPEYSRARLQAWVKAGQVRVDEQLPRPRDKVVGGEVIRVRAEIASDAPLQAQPIALDIRYEDVALLVVNKPAGLVVHPAAGNPDGTLQNALLHHHPALAVVPRAGIVHRLDKLTSGLMVVAKTLEAHTDLVRQLQARSVGREYLALAQGGVSAGGMVDAPLGRHPVERKRIAVVDAGRHAVSHYRVEERFRAHTLLRVRLETGRTHQIRVHMAHIHHPLVGDPVYGGRLRLPKGASDELVAALRGFRRQALHATRLTLRHPASGAALSWEVQAPADFQDLLTACRRDAAMAGDA